MMKASSHHFRTETENAGIRSGAFQLQYTESNEPALLIRFTEIITDLLPLRTGRYNNMVKGIVNRLIPRLLILIAASFPLKLLLDLIFRLFYRNHEILRPAEEYLGAALLTLLTLETVRLLKKQLERHYPWEKSPLRRLAIEIAAGSVLVTTLIVAINLPMKIYLLEVQFIQLSDEIITTLYYLFLFALIPAFVEFALFLLKRWRDGLAEMERFRKENAEYRFETLRTQVNPHFLFNSLNTLSSLMYEDRDKAAGFIRDLSDVYRYVLDNRNKELIPLSDELKFIRSFVYLYQLRFDNKLEVVFDVPEDQNVRLIAPMTLQLLIENAVKHNIVSARKPLTIRIDATGSGYIAVSNNLQKKTNGVVSSGIGLANISSRYGFLTDKPVEVIESETEFIVKVPLI